jgi:hypothetical protein
LVVGSKNTAQPSFVDPRQVNLPHLNIKREVMKQFVKAVNKKMQMPQRNVKNYQSFTETMLKERISRKLLLMLHLKVQ